jgi:hypothetical protein
MVLIFDDHSRNVFKVPYCAITNDGLFLAGYELS